MPRPCRRALDGMEASVGAQSFPCGTYANARFNTRFSADTMPCEALIHAGSDATLLIHEATMDDDRKQMAEEKGHTTVGQAIEVAVK